MSKQTDGRTDGHARAVTRLIRTPAVHSKSNLLLSNKQFISTLNELTVRIGAHMGQIDKQTDRQTNEPARPVMWLIISTNKEE